MAAAVCPNGLHFERNGASLRDCWNEVLCVYYPVKLRDQNDGIAYWPQSEVKRGAGVRASPFNGVAGKLVLLVAAELNAAQCVPRMRLATFV